MTGPVIVPEAIVLPTGADPDDYDSWRGFALRVQSQVSRGWVVTDGFPDTRLSRKGRKWSSSVAPHMRRFYYFPTFDEAVDAAKEAVDSYQVNGRTWAQWQELFNSGT